MGSTFSSHDQGSKVKSFDNLPNKSFYFVRHGATDWSKNDIAKGPQNHSLNSLGVKQAKNCAQTIAKKLEGSNQCNIVSSTLARARETAKEISTATGFDISMYDDDIKERYYGDYRKIANSSLNIPPDAETDDVFHTRVCNGLHKILSTYEEPIVIVSHQKVFQYVAKSLRNPKYDQQVKRLDNAGICYFAKKDHLNHWELQYL